MIPSKYTFELWSPDGTLMADFSGRANNRRIVQSRNEAELIVWTLDLNEFERYCDDTGQHPNQLIVPGNTEVRVRRGRNYIAGAQINYRDPHILDSTQDLEVRAAGFLNLWQDRFTAEEREFTATQAAQMPATLITESQTGSNRSFGITIGSVATVGAHDKTFKAVEIKEAIQRCAAQFNFDFEFTHDKVFNTYASLGSPRPELIFEYPGNVIQIPSSPLDATNIKNYVTVLGSGSGTEANARVVVQDTTSQITNKVREDRISFSDVEDETDLERHGQQELDAWSEPFEIPTLLVDGNVPPYVTDYGIGDWVTIRCTKYRTLENINGLFRIEKREITVDENDSEKVRLWVSGGTPT